MILGTPNYLGDVSAAFRALYERLIFQSLTYKTEPRSYNKHLIPVLLIMTSNASVISGGVSKPHLVTSAVPLFMWLGMWAFIPLGNYFYHSYVLGTQN